jgi:nucleotide-binding universal stress UspA family protein
MKVLIPTDFSNNAGHAINYASLLGQVMNANLILLHVYTPPVTRGNVVYSLIAEEIDRMMKEATEKLLTISSTLSENYGLSCEYRVRMGSPVDEIVMEAENSHTDLIVMGTLGASGLTKMVFGSNTVAVIERATCPVLVVPANATLALPKKIVFATDYEDSDIQTVKELIKITRRLKAEFILLHVSKENLRSDRDLIEDFSKAVATEVHVVQPFYYVMHHENPQEGIDHFVNSVGAHLIALSMRKRSIFKKLFGFSLSKKMVYQACLPLLIFHAVQPESGYNDF